MAQLQPSGNTSDVLRAVWEAVKLLTGENGLHADDHLTRLEVLAETQRALELAVQAETLAAAAGGASLAELGKALGVSRTSAHKRLHRPAAG